jgi:hypothetical protein
MPLAGAVTHMTGRIYGANSSGGTIDMTVNYAPAGTSFTSGPIAAATYNSGAVYTAPAGSTFAAGATVYVTLTTASWFQSTTGNPAGVCFGLWGTLGSATQPSLLTQFVVPAAQLTANATAMQIGISGVTG